MSAVYVSRRPAFAFDVVLRLCLVLSCGYVWRRPPFTFRARVAPCER